jgi:HAMP domain-containing protein
MGFHCAIGCDEPQMGLTTKINLALLAACAIGLAIGALVLSRVFTDDIRGQALQNARIMMTEADAIRHYTADRLVPLLPTERDGQFVAETVPDFAAKTTFHELREAFPSYNYREPALNPTAPSDRAADWEAGVIQTFRNHSDERELVVERDTPLGATLNLARPITVDQASCFRCHSFPFAAPSALTASYGTSNGFGWKFNETIGAQIVSVPMAVSFQAERTALISFLIMLIGIFAIIFLVLNLLLRYLVIGPVKRLSEAADAASLGKEGVEIYVRTGKDEIVSLAQSFNRMRESLRHAVAMVTR